VMQLHAGGRARNVQHGVTANNFVRQSISAITHS
jgi:hypothetical protein